MKGTSRHAGWAAVANPEPARKAFERWANGATLDLRALVLARDYAVMNRRWKGVVGAINRDLRAATLTALETQTRTFRRGRS
jgi:hypothetical protein